MQLTVVVVIVRTRFCELCVIENVVAVSILTVAVSGIKNISHLDYRITISGIDRLLPTNSFFEHAVIENSRFAARISILSVTIPKI